MKKNFGLLCLLFLLSSPASPQAPGANQRPLVLTHFTVIDTTGGPAQPDMTVVIRGDRVVEMGKSGKIRVTPGSEVVDGTGKFLIPGLWDMSAWFYEKDYLPIFIANGVIGVREMEAYAEHYEFRKEIEAGQLLGPRMVIGTRGVEGPKLIHPWTIPTANQAEARQAVINAQKYGADFIRLGVTISVREAALLQGFPEKYRFLTNQMDAVCELIGNAVPPPYAELAGNQILKAIKDRETLKKDTKR
jgi:hypothetical protein